MNVNRNIDKLGRATAIGTRKLWTGRGRERIQDKPLSFELAVHPQRASPTYTQPKHTERMGQHGVYATIKHTGEWPTLYVQGDYAVVYCGTVIGFHNDYRVALGVVNALKSIAVDGEVAHMVDRKEVSRLRAKESSKQGLIDALDERIRIHEADIGSLERERESHQRELDSIWKQQDVIK